MEPFQQFGRVLMVLGVAIAVLGACVYFFGNSGFGSLGRLPGDILIERENVTIYVPITTCLLLSAILSLLLYLFGRF
jgi:hypothetical protein